MTDKPVITDEMVERALNATPWKRCTELTINMRHILTAALTEPPEEEIEVSPAMRKKGGDILCGRFGVSYQVAHDGVSHIYRAMRAIEIEESASVAPTFGPTLYWTVEGFKPDRRKDDQA